MEWPRSAPRPRIPCAQGSLESCRRGERFAHKMCRLRLRAPACSQNVDCRQKLPGRGGADGTCCAQNVRLVDSFPASPAHTGCAAAALREATPFSRPSSAFVGHSPVCIVRDRKSWNPAEMMLSFGCTGFSVPALESIPGIFGTD